MTKNTLNAIYLSLLSIFAVACGDAGADPGPGEVLAGEEGANPDDPNVEDGEANADVDEQDGEGGDNADNGDVIDPDPIEPDDPNAGDEDPQVFDAEGQIEISVIIDSLISNEEPLADGCTGTVALAFNEGALSGEGLCFLDANDNTLGYELDADVDENGDVDGDIDIILNGRSNVIPVTGSVQNGVLSLEFNGVTLVTSNIRAVWDGVVIAEFG